MSRAEVTGRKPGVSADLDPPPLVRGPPVDRTVPQLAMSIPQFAEAHGISASMYFKLKKQGLTPREMKVGSRTLITFEAAAQWRAEREAASGTEATRPRLHQSTVFCVHRAGLGENQGCHH